LDYKSGKIDLHIHSDASDGSLSPEQVISLAQASGLAAISITDHDTVDGVIAVMGQPILKNLEFISGVEISADYPPGFKGPGSMHILGYGFDPHDPHLGKILKKQQESRSSRNPEIIKKLQSLGIFIKSEDIAAEAGKDEIARPHIAAHMVRKGYASSIDDAFDRFLAKGQPAYVEKFRISAHDAIMHIRNSRGIAVLAHPGLLSYAPGSGLEELVACLAAMGLGGIEALYSGHSPEQTEAFKKTAGQLGLLITGGSDFHGEINPNIEMGKGLGDLNVPYEIFIHLCNALEKQNKKN
jgi:hypothetical protein